MSELRKDYFIERWSLLSPKRAKRSNDFLKPNRIAVPPEHEKIRYPTCPFCQGMELETPPAHLIYKVDKKAQLTITNDPRDSPTKRIKDWNLRVFSNRFPAVNTTDNENTDYNSPLIMRQGIGFHEVIVETSTHNHRIQNYHDQEIRLLIKAYYERMAFLVQQDQVRYISVFRNFGRSAGASKIHPHSQILTLPIIPDPIQRETLAASLGSPSMKEIIELERSTERFLFTNEAEDWLAWCPFSPIQAFEIWIVPFRSFASLVQSTSSEREHLGFFLRKTIKALTDVLGDIPYNYLLYQNIEDPQYHFSLRILPALTKYAGFEHNTGIAICDVTPEFAATKLRNVG